MTINRRMFLKSCAAAAGAVALHPGRLWASCLSDARVAVLPDTLPFNFTEQTFSITFVNGQTPIVPGMKIFFRANFWMVDETVGTGRVGQMAAGIGFQTGQPLQENHVSLQPQDNGTSAVLGLDLGFVNQQKRMVIVSIASGQIKPQEQFTITIRRCQSLNILPGAGVTTNANEQAFWCVIGDPTGAQPEPDTGATYCLVPITGGYLLPGEPDSVWAVAPSMVKTGQSFPLRLSILDDRDNLVTSYVGTLPAACTDPAAQFPASIEFTPEDQGVKSVNVTLNTPGVHRFTITGMEKTFTSNIIDVRPDLPPQRIWWGDYHNHSMRCDGTGDPNRLAAYAREVAHLDWFVLTSHDAPPWRLEPPGPVAPLFVGAMRWDDLRDIMDGIQEPGRFVTLPAYEWTSGFDDNGDAGDGHRIALALNWDDLLPVLQWTDSNYDDSAEVYRGLRERTRDFMFLPHHLNAYQWWHVPAGGSAPALSDEEKRLFMPLAEIYSQLHGNQESEAEKDWRPAKDWNTQPTEPAYFVGGLLKGMVTGVLAGGDNHAGRPGSWLFGALTAVVTDDFSRAGIFRALRQRHCYATSGCRLIMEFSLGDAIMGDEVPFGPGEPPPTFHYRVATPGDITRLRLIRAAPSGTAAILNHIPDAGTREISGDFTDNGFDPAWDFATYFLSVEHEIAIPHAYYQDLVDRGWTSPIFLRRNATDTWHIH